MEIGSVDPGPMPTPSVAPTACTSPPQVTPVISINSPVFRCSSVTPGQVISVTRVNVPEVSSLQTTEASAANLSSPSANTQAYLNERNNSFKIKMDCTPAYPPASAISSSKAVRTSLSTNPVLQVAPLSCHFHQLTAQASAFSHLPRHRLTMSRPLWQFLYSCHRSNRPASTAHAQIAALLQHKHAGYL